MGDQGGGGSWGGSREVKGDQPVQDFNVIPAAEALQLLQLAGQELATTHAHMIHVFRQMIQMIQKIHHVARMARSSRLQAAICEEPFECGQHQQGTAPSRPSESGRRACGEH